MNSHRVYHPSGTSGIPLVPSTSLPFTIDTASLPPPSSIQQPKYFSSVASTVGNPSPSPVSNPLRSPHILISSLRDQTDYVGDKREMEIRRLDIVWKETGKQWMNRHGIAFPRLEDETFRDKVELGSIGEAQDLTTKEWCEMWETNNNSWTTLRSVAYLRDECLQTRIRSWVETGRYHQRLIGFWERVLINNTPPEPFHKASATNESSSSKPRAPTPNRILAECAKNTHFGRPITPPPPPATRTYSLPREQALKATNLDGLINPPARANSRSPGVGVHQTRGVHSHPDDYNHASTSFVSGYLSNPASSYDSSEPSGIEEGHVPPLFGVATQLEMRPRRLELVWRETQRRWRDKHGTTLPRWQDKDFRLKIEGGYGIEDDVPVDRAWRDMWNDVNNCWLESEVLWRMRGGEKAIQSHPNYLNLAHRKLFVDRAIAEIFSIFEKNGTDMSQLKKGKRDASQILTNLRPLDAPLIGTKPLPLPVSLLQPNQTARAESDPVLETNDKPASPPLAPRVYISYNQAQVRVEGVPMEPPQRMDESAIRRVDAAVGAKVAAAAAETFDRAENKKRLKEAELRAQEERRVAEEQLAREQRRAEEDRRLREEQRAEEAWRREAVERQREERARYEYQKRESEDRKRRWAADPLIDRGSRSRQPAHEPSVLDAWNAYELRWSALSASSPNQLIGFRDIPWPLLRVPSGPESITPQAVGAFILSPLHSQDKSRKERLRNAMLRWHSDKFEGRWMARIEEDERPKVKEAVRGVFTSLVQIMNGSEFSDGKAKPVIISVPQEPAVTIGKHMSVQDIIGHLAGRGCQDLTAGLDLSSFSECPNSHGGFSDVYRGRLSTGAHIAVKALRISTENIENPKHLKRAARELYTWSNCKHPNVLQLLGLAVFRGRIGMVSPWMDHGTLPRYLDGNTEMDRCNLCVQICDGLAYLHETGIVHGDLKGANVLALADGTPVLTDFGNSIFLGRTLLFTETTREGSLTGRWAAPELLEGSGQPSKEADIYALGMTILEVITGRVPYDGKGDFAVLKLVSKKKHPERPNEHIPTESRDGNKLWRLLKKCWAHDPEKRPSASRVAEIMRPITPQGLKANNVL